MCPMNKCYKMPFHVNRTFILLLILFATVLCAGWRALSSVHGIFIGYDTIQSRAMISLAANVVNERILSRLLRLQALTNIPSNSTSQDLNKILNELKAEVPRMGYLRIAVVSADGSAVATDGSRFNIAEEEQFKKASGGFMLTSDILTDRVKDNTHPSREIIVLEAPFYFGAEVRGTIAATMRLTDASSLLRDIDMPYSGATLFIVDRNFSVIAHSQVFPNGRLYIGKNCGFFDFISDILSDDELDNIRANLATSDSSIYSYRDEQHERCISFAPLTSSNGWKLIAVSSPNSIRASQSAFIHRAMLLVMAALIIAFFIIGYLYILNWKYQKISALSKNTIDKAGFYILMLSPNGKVLYCDRAFTEFLGLPENKSFSLLPLMEDDQTVFPAVFGGDYRAKLRLKLRNGKEKYLIIRTIGDGEHGYYHTLALDVSDDETAQQKILDLAYIDQTTRLPNRASFAMKVDEMAAQPSGSKSLHAYLFIDINDARKILETFAENTYMNTLLEAAQRLSAVASRCGGLVYGLDNDDYVIIVNGLKDISETEKICAMVRESFAAPFHNGDNSFMVTCRIGVVPGSDSANHTNISSSDIFKFGEIAVRHAKASNNTFLLDMETYISTMKELDMELDLGNAIANGELSLYYQPIYSTLEDRIHGAEALLRWNSPKHGSVSPAIFIPMAERCGLINKIGDFVTERSMEFASRIAQKNIKIEFNVSVVQFMQADFVKKLCEMSRKYSLPPKSVGIEITESALSNNKESFTSKLNSIRGEGILVSIDDFGTGYSSLSYLKDMPADYMKIDKSFVDYLQTSSKQRIIFNSIVSLGLALGLKIIVEGVETPEQFSFAIESSCDLIQGFLISKPLPEKDFIAFLDSFSI